MGFKPRTNNDLADRVRAILASRTDVVEKRMFGGLAFMVRGHMSVGINKSDLMARVGPDWEKYLKEPGARPMDFTGRPLRGFLYVKSSAVQDRAVLQRWVKRCVAFAESMPRK